MLVLDVELPELLICLINRLTEPGRTESLRADPRLSSAVLLLQLRFAVRLRLQSNLIHT